MVPFHLLCSLVNGEAKNRLTNSIKDLKIFQYFDSKRESRLRFQGSGFRFFTLLERFFWVLIVHC